jgi:hypothetical protein
MSTSEALIMAGMRDCEKTGAAGKSPTAGQDRTNARIVRSR